MVTFKDNLFFLITRTYELSLAQQMALLAGLIFASAAFAYMLGSLNFAIIISKLKYHDDIRNHGSGNGGATNMLRTYGKGAAAAALACDMVKCVAAVLIGELLWGNDGAYIAGLFCVIGHVFPCWHRFRGGKGVATMAAVVLLTNPLVFIILFIIFAGIVLLTKYVSLASIMCALLYPIILNSFIPIEQKTGTDIIMAFLMSMIVFFMHTKNMKRLLDKTEPKTELFKRKPKPAEQSDTVAEQSETPDTENTASVQVPQKQNTGKPIKKGTNKKKK